MKNRRAILLLGAGTLLAAAGVAALSRQSETPNIEVAHASSEKSFASKEQTSAGLCPWRNPDADLKRFFPNAIGYADETLVLSHNQQEITQRLGRPPTGEDNALIVHRILGKSSSPGVVVTRRVRGEAGVIELALAVDASGTVRGARIQRLREPDEAARALQSERFLGAFRGKTCRSDWQTGKDLPVVAAARPSAEALAGEARTVLTLLDIAMHSDTSRSHETLTPILSKNAP